MCRRFQILSLAFLSCLLLSLATQLEAVKPVATVGNPPLIDIQYSPNGRFLATLVNSYVNPYVEFLDSETFVPIKRLDATDGKKIDFSPDGSLLAVFGNANIQIWKVDFQQLLATIPVKTEIAEFSPNGKYLAYAEKDSVFLWDISQKQTVRELTGDPPTKTKGIPNIVWRYSLNSKSAARRSNFVSSGLLGACCRLNSSNRCPMGCRNGRNSCIF